VASSRRILEIYIRSMNIYETGDRKVPEAQNAVMALLNYPRPGKAEVMVTTGHIPGLSDSKTLRFSPPKLLLKEFVQGPTDLLLTVTDRDDKNRLVALLRRLSSTFLGSAGEVAEAVVPGVLRAAFQEAVASGRLAIGERTEDKVEVVGVGALPLPDLDKVSKNNTVDLTAPIELKRRGKPPIKRGASNGQIDLIILVKEP
jgi:hypothetical protein